MSALTFVIPTRGRARQLSAAVRSIAEQVAEAEVNIIVLWNKAEADTSRAIARCKENWPFVEAVACDGEPDYSEKFRAMMRAAPDSDWVWTFGDDDKLQPGALRAMLQRLAVMASDISFVHVAERKRSNGTGHMYTGRLIDLCCQLGWLDMTGFISGNITRGGLLAKCAETPNWPLYAKSAYVHSCAIFETLLRHKAQFIDLPLVGTQEEQQSAQVLAQWAQERTAERYFYVAQALAAMMEKGIIKAKLPAKFFRYVNYHLWDRHLSYFAAGFVESGQAWDDSWAFHVKLLADMVSDEAVAESVRADVDAAVAMAAAGDVEGLTAIGTKHSQSLYPYTFADHHKAAA